MFDFKIVTSWIENLLRVELGLDNFWTLAIEFVLVGVALLAAYALIALVLIYAERKICAFFQCRIGPDRVGKWGLIQVIADMIKILTKEIIPIKRSEKLLFFLAPFFVIIGSFLTFGALPFAKGLHAIDFNIGVLYILAVSSLGVIGIVLAGWSSNNKYSLIGAMRAGAQLISYEISAGLALMTMVVLAGSMQLSTIVESQADGWFIFKGGIFWYNVRFLLCGRVHQPVHNISHRHYNVPRRMDAAAHTRPGRIQPSHGLHTIGCLVLRQMRILHLPRFVG